MVIFLLDTCSGHPLLGPHALANVYGADHTAIRKALIPAFNQRAIQANLAGIVELAESTLKEWSRREHVR